MYCVCVCVCVGRGGVWMCVWGVGCVHVCGGGVHVCACMRCVCMCVCVWVVACVCMCVCVYVCVVCVHENEPLLSFPPSPFLPLSFPLTLSSLASPPSTRKSTPALAPHPWSPQVQTQLNKSSLSKIHTTAKPEQSAFTLSTETGILWTYIESP